MGPAEVMKHASSVVLRDFPTAVVHAPCRCACSWTSGGTVVGKLVAGALPAVIWGRNLHVNLSSSALRRLYHMVTGIPARGAW